MSLIIIFDIWGAVWDKRKKGLYKTNVINTELKTDLIKKISLDSFDLVFFIFIIEIS